METVEAAIEYVSDHMEKGCHCPVCSQYVKLYKIHLNARMIQTMISFAKKHRYVHAPSFLSKQLVNDRSYPKLVHWKFIKEQVNTNTKKRCSGWWKLTKRGRRFLKGEIVAPKYALVFNNDLYGYSPERIDVHTALDEYFDYEKIF